MFRIVRSRSLELTLASERESGFQHDEIGTVVGALDAAIRVVLEFDGEVEPVVEDVAGADVVTELEPGGECLPAVAPDLGQEVHANGSFRIQAALVVALVAEGGSQADVPQVLAH